MTSAQRQLYSARLRIARAFGTGGATWIPVTASGATPATPATISAGERISLYVLDATMIRSVQAPPQVGIYTAAWWGIGAAGLTIAPGTILVSAADPTLAFLVDGAADTSQGAPLFPLAKTVAPQLETGNMSAGQYNGWVIEEGAVFASAVKWPGISSAAGYSARMDIRATEDPAGALILSLTVANSRIVLSSDGTNLVISLSILASDTKLLDFTTAYYDLEVVPPAGEAAVFKALYGQIGYRREVTAA